MRRISLYLTAFASLFLTACDSTGNGPGPQPGTVTLTLEWDGIDVIGDCEGSIPASNTGDFEFIVTVNSNLGGDTRSTEVMNRESNPNTGDTVNVSNSDTSFEINEDESGEIRVTFEATENDPTGPDSDMDGRSDATTHTFTSGQWSRLGDNRIRLGSSSSCRVELQYRASAS